MHHYPSFVLIQPLLDKVTMDQLKRIFDNTGFNKDIFGLYYIRRFLTERAGPFTIPPYNEKVAVLKDTFLSDE